MDRRQGSDPQLSHLPSEPIDRITEPLSRFLLIETASGAVLLLFAVIALIAANSPWADSFLAIWNEPFGFQAGSLSFVHPAKVWINDGLMTLFFFLVAMELKRELILGELRKPRVAALSIAAALGGMVTPAVIYLSLQSGLPGEQGWGTVMATDTAFVIGCLALLGRRVPQGLRVFLLSLAVVDDIGAILVVAFGYSEHIGWVALVAGGIGLATVPVMALLGIRSIAAYILVGCGAWVAINASGIHPTITGVALGLLTPTRGWVSDRRLRAILGKVLSYPPGDHWRGAAEDQMSLRAAGVAARETISPVERLEAKLHPWVAFGVMPLFALANAGVPFSFHAVGDPVALAVVGGFVFGKPVGVVVFAWLAVRVGLATRPADLGWGTLAGGGMLAGIGFTMALLIAGLAFHDTLLQAAKIGILAASVISAVGGVTLLAWLGRHRSRQAHQDE